MKRARTSKNQYTTTTTETTITESTLPDCPICKTVVSLPISLVPCGHTVCSACLTELRTRAGTSERPLHTIFRCPLCRRLSTSYIISEFVRELVSNANALSKTDVEFLNSHVAALPNPSGPTIRERLSAASVDNLNDIIFDNSDTDDDDSTEDVDEVHLLYDPVYSEFMMNIIEGRVPLDLRLWSLINGETCVYTYTYYRAILPPTAEQQFHQRMLLRGVSVTRLDLGYYLVLPAANRNLFEKA